MTESMHLHNNVCVWVTHYLCAHERVIFCVNFPSCCATREINTKITLKWLHKKFFTRVHYTLSYFLHVEANLSMAIKTRIFSHRPRVSLARFTFCRWRHNRLPITSQWSDNCDANTRHVKSNSLHIDFIHSDIHAQSCKKNAFEPTNDTPYELWGVFRDVFWEDWQRYNGTAQ